MTTSQPVIAYYISAHGYGHGVRSCDILRAWHGAFPASTVHVVTDLPEAFLRNRLPAGDFRFRPGSFDVGMVQLDSIRVDVPATLERVADVYGRRDDLVRAERIFLEEQGVDVVVADVPAIPIEAAKAAGLPALAVGNFSWDWIYSAFHDRDPRWAGMSAAFADGYAKTDLLLRLPFYGDMSSFPRRVDVGLVAAPGRNRRAELAALTGADTGKRWVLLSFTSLEWSEEALRAVEGLTDYEFFTVEPLGWPIANAHGVDRARVPFCDIMASVDGVVSKPGFGMLSECIVNRKPLLYADRTDFIEYPILVEALEKYLQNQHVPAEELYRGAIGPYLDRLWTRPAPGETVASDGAAAAVAQIARYLDRPVPYEDASRNLNPEP